MDADSRTCDGRTELPPAFAKHAAAVTGLDAPPKTLEDWWTSVTDSVAAPFPPASVVPLLRKLPHEQS